MSVCDVSVVIPNFKRTNLLRRALRSVEDQTCRPREVIVIDDCSPTVAFENIISIIDSFRDSLNIVFLVNDRNVGANASRNRGIAAASSTYVAFLDSDDLWMPSKLELQMNGITRAKSDDDRPVLCATGRYRLNQQGDIIARQFGGSLLTAEKIRRANFIGTLSSVIVETASAQKLGGFREKLAACQDWDFFIRLADHVQYVGVPQPLCVYFDHDGERITLKNKKRLQAHLYIYRTHIKPALHSPLVDVSEMYRAIAEEMQQSGKRKKANRFYAAYKSSTRVRWSFGHYIKKRFWHGVYSIIDAPDIKRLRYQKYIRALEKHKASNGACSQISIDQGRINSLNSVLLQGDGLSSKRSSVSSN